VGAKSRMAAGGRTKGSGPREKRAKEDEDLISRLEDVGRR
jgi:polyribonucleotide nucleotidyltransferase